MEDHGIWMQENNDLQSKKTQEITDKYVELANKENKTKEEEESLINVRKNIVLIFVRY